MSECARKSRAHNHIGRHHITSFVNSLQTVQQEEGDAASCCELQLVGKNKSRSSASHST